MKIKAHVHELTRHEVRSQGYNKACLGPTAVGHKGFLSKDIKQAWELSKEKTSETRGVRGHAPPNFCFLLHSNLCNQVVLKRKVQLSKIFFFFLSILFFL